MYCVDVSDSCEKTRFKNEECMTTDMCMSMSVVFVAMCISIPLIFIFDVLCIYTSSIKVDGVTDIGKGARKCGMQWFMSLLCASIAIYFASNLYMSLKYRYG